MKEKLHFITQRIIHVKETIQGLCKEEKDDITIGYELGQLYSLLGDIHIDLLNLDYMKVTTNHYEEQEGWKAIYKFPPPTDIRVQIASIRMLDWNLYVMEFDSTGFFKSNGKMSIKINKKYPKVVYTDLADKITHWKELN